MGSRNKGPRLASLQPDIDTRDLFAQLMKDAERGDVDGAVIVAFKRRHEETHTLYDLHLSGRAATNATFSTGAVAACQIILRELASKAGRPTVNRKGQVPSRLRAAFFGLN